MPRWWSQPQLCWGSPGMEGLSPPSSWPGVTLPTLCPLIPAAFPPQAARAASISSTSQKRRLFCEVAPSWASRCESVFCFVRTATFFLSLRAVCRNNCPTRALEENNQSPLGGGLLLGDSRVYIGSNAHGYSWCFLALWASLLPGNIQGNKRLTCCLWSVINLLGRKGLIPLSSKGEDHCKSLIIPGFALPLYTRQSTEINGNTWCAWTYTIRGFIRSGLAAYVVQEIIFEVIHLHSWHKEKRMRIKG